MSLANLAIKRPVFITCIVLLMLVVGLVSFKRLGVDLFPDVTFPVVFVSTPYPGAGPSEIETLVSKPIEEEVSTLAGIKRVSSISQEGVSVVVAEFTLETDVKYAEQQIRDRLNSVRRKLPQDVKDSVTRRLDPADQPVIQLALETDMSPAETFDLANEIIKPKLEQVEKVGLVEIIGGRKREIQVLLDRAKLKSREVSVTQVANRLAATGQDIPAGRMDVGGKEVVFRALGQFESLKDIEKQVVSFFGSDVSVTVGEVGEVKDTLKDEKSRAYLNGKQSLFIFAFKQSGANTVAVADAITAKLSKINDDLKAMGKSAKITQYRDASRFIRLNVDDVKESILIGTLLTIVVVFFFLGNLRSTIITGLALPNSLIGAFIIMYLAGFTINLMSMLALSLAVGLLVDDAIVVRENIFRHMEMGKSPKRAALDGTLEVTLAVVATTLTVLAVFGPVGFLKGVVGQFFKQFGLTICFAMAISLFDSLTIAPMLSAYFAGGVNHKNSAFFDNTIGIPLRWFESFQVWLEKVYGSVLRVVIARPWVALVPAVAIFFGGFVSLKYVSKTFLPAQEQGEFSVSLELPPGTTLTDMADIGTKVDTAIRKHPEVEISAMSVGNRDGDSNVAEFYVKLVPMKMRKISTIQLKQILRDELKEFARANPKVKDFDAIGAGQRPFVMKILGEDQKQLEEVASQILKIAKDNPNLSEPDWNYRTGKPEFQAVINPKQADMLGVSSSVLGLELRNQIEGATPAVFRQKGLEYDIRVRLKDDQRNLEQAFSQAYVPNINFNLIRISDVAKPVSTTGPAKITRQDRGRSIEISADITPGKGLDDAVKEIAARVDAEIKMPAGMRYIFIGQAENSKELGEGIAVAMGLGVLFIYMVLASLYESFVTPLTIMLALPLAICGAFYALALSHESLNIFSQIGIIMLLGVATKNSILLVDYANRMILQGKSRTEAIMEAGKVRLRPILMTSMALIAGTIPIALGLNEASRQRVSMGIAIIGGLVTSTLLTLIVVPAAYAYIDRFRVWSLGILSRLFMSESDRDDDESGNSKGSGGNGHSSHAVGKKGKDGVLEVGAST